jgi:hypothetical protein
MPLPELFKVLSPSRTHHGFHWQVNEWNTDPLPFVADPAIVRGKGGLYLATHQGLARALALGCTIHRARVDEQQPHEWVQLNATCVRAKRVFLEPECWSVFDETTRALPLLPALTTKWDNPHLVHWALADGRLDVLDEAFARDPTAMVIHNRWLRTVLHASLVSVAAYHGQIACLDWLWERRETWQASNVATMFANPWVLWSVLTDVSMGDVALRWFMQEDKGVTRLDQCMNLSKKSMLVEIEVGAILTRVCTTNHCVAMRRAWFIPQLQPRTLPLPPSSLSPEKNRQASDDEPNEEEEGESLWLQQYSIIRGASWCRIAARYTTDTSVDALALAVTQHFQHTGTTRMWRALYRNGKNKLGAAAIERLHSALPQSLLRATHPDWLAWAPALASSCLKAE